MLNVAVETPGEVVLYIANKQSKEGRNNPSNNNNNLLRYLRSEELS